MTKRLWQGCTYDIDCCLCAFCRGNLTCNHPNYIKEKEILKKMTVKWRHVDRFSIPEGYKMNEKGNIMMDFSVPRCRYCTHFFRELGCLESGNGVYEKINNPEIVINCDKYIIDDSKWPETSRKVKAEKEMHGTLHDDRQARFDQIGGDTKTTWDQTKELEARKKEKEDAGFLHTSVGEWNDHYNDYNSEKTFTDTSHQHTDALDAISSGKGFIMPGEATFYTDMCGKPLDLKGEDSMVIIDKDIKDKERQINKILETRKLFIKNFYESFEDLDKKLIDDHLFEWGVRKDFLKFLLTKVNKKNRKKAKKLFNRLRFYTDQIDFIFKGTSNQDVTRLDGENWFVVKKLIAMIKKYGCVYINDVFRTKYSDLSSNYDTLVFDDEKTICEACGTENDCVAIFCNNCGKRF